MYKLAPNLEDRFCFCLILHTRLVSCADGMHVLYIHDLVCGTGHRSAHIGPCTCSYRRSFNARLPMLPEVTTHHTLTCVFMAHMRMKIVITTYSNRSIHFASNKNTNYSSYNHYKKNEHSSNTLVRAKLVPSRNFRSSEAI